MTIRLKLLGQNRAKFKQQKDGHWTLCVLHALCVSEKKIEIFFTSCKLQILVRLLKVNSAVVFFVV